MDIPINYVNHLAEYVEKNLKKGYTPDSLKVSLMNQGYSRISVEKAIELANERLADKAPKVKEKPQIIRKLITEDNKTLILENQEKGFFKRFFKKIFS